MFCQCFHLLKEHEGRTEMWAVVILTQWRAADYLQCQRSTPALSLIAKQEGEIERERR